MGIQLTNDDSVLITTRIMPERTGKLPFEINKPHERFEYLKAKVRSKFIFIILKRVVLTTNGAPYIEMNPQNFPQDKFIDAESFLQEAGYQKVYSSVRKIQGKKGLVILGGNKIGFACLQLLLKGFEYEEAREEILNRNGPFLTKRFKKYQQEKIKSYDPLMLNDAISMVSGSTLASKSLKYGSQASTKSKLSIGSHQSSLSQKGAMSLQKVVSASPTKDAQKNSASQEFEDFLNSKSSGSLRGVNYYFLEKCKTHLHFEEGEVLLVYDPQELKVYCRDDQDARNIHYEYHRNEKTKNGEINPVNGIAGDAKRLYYDVAMNFIYVIIIRY